MGGSGTAPLPAPNTQPTVPGHVVPGSMELNGVPIEAGQTYRVGTLNFLADGGDLFTAFGQGTNRVGGPRGPAEPGGLLHAHTRGSRRPASRITGL